MQAPEIATVEDMVRVLDEHPQWLEALRARLLTRELLTLPQTLADFIAATDRRFAEVDRRFDVLERQMVELRTDLERQMVELRTDLERQMGELRTDLERQMGELRTDLERQMVELRTDLERQMVELRTDLERQVGELRTDLECQVGELRTDLERQMDQLRTDIGPLKAAHARNAAMDEAGLIAQDLGLSLVGILGRAELGSLVQSADTGDISKDDLRSFHRADMVLRAADPAGTERYLAVEVSYTANGRDTERARRNARFLTRFTGLDASAVVASLRLDQRVRPAVESGAVAWFQLDAEVLEVD